MERIAIHELKASVMVISDWDSRCYKIFAGPCLRRFSELIGVNIASRSRVSSMCVLPVGGVRLGLRVPIAAVPAPEQSMGRVIEKCLGIGEQMLAELFALQQ